MYKPRSDHRGVHNRSHVHEGDNMVTNRSGMLLIRPWVPGPTSFTDVHSIERFFERREKPHVKLIVAALELGQNGRI